MASLPASSSFASPNSALSAPSADERLRFVEFLIHSAQQLEVAPIVKYSALSLLVDRFFLSLPSFMEAGSSRSWLLHPVTESNLQLFGLISLWISSKIHDSYPLSVRCLKCLANNIIKDQHFATRDFLEAEVLFMQVLNFEIGTTNIAFLFLEELWMQIQVAKVGDLINFEACIEIMDLLYEKEETSFLYKSPCSLAASILVASYLITVPKQKSEFPLLPWGKKVKFVTSCREEEIIKIVRDILKHVLHPSSDLQGDGSQLTVVRPTY
ncbi:cyclin-J18-like isoform X2 [Prosopis cineraria]|uniref:cyclin-J18-like isoform X2 n=1 Tax=Prosopis cineraria TaxID=364024 RepID=UPI00240F156E|nr:cyclin-J18-like isoform X2 [Prosopis cineraria]